MAQVQLIYNVSTIQIMPLNIVKNIYRQREEISIKLIEYLTQLEKQEIDKQMYDEMLGLYEFVNNRQIEIDKLENQLFKIYKIQMFQYLLDISCQYELLVFTMTSENNCLIKKYNERINQQKCLKDTNQILLLQQKYFYSLLKYFKEYLKNRAKCLSESKRSLELFQNFNCFIQVLEIDQNLTKKHLLFLINLQNKTLNQQDVYNFEEILNIEKQPLVLTPILDYFDLYINMFRSKNSQIANSLKKYKKKYDKSDNRQINDNTQNNEKQLYQQNQLKEKFQAKNSSINNILYRKRSLFNKIVNAQIVTHLKIDRKKEIYQVNKLNNLKGFFTPKINFLKASYLKKQSISHYKKNNHKLIQNSHQILPKQNEFNQLENQKQSDNEQQSENQTMKLKLLQNKQQSFFSNSFQQRAQQLSGRNAQTLKINSINILDFDQNSHLINSSAYVKFQEKNKKRKNYNQQINQNEKCFQSQDFPIRSMYYVKLRPNK